MYATCVAELSTAIELAFGGFIKITYPRDRCFFRKLSRNILYCFFHKPGRNVGKKDGVCVGRKWIICGKDISLSDCYIASIGMKQSLDMHKKQQIRIDFIRNKSGIEAFFICCSGGPKYNDTVAGPEIIQNHVIREMNLLQNEGNVASIAGEVGDRRKSLQQEKRRTARKQKNEYPKGSQKVDHGSMINRF